MNPNDPMSYTNLEREYDRMKAKEKSESMVKEDRLPEGTSIETYEAKSLTAENNETIKRIARKEYQDYVEEEVFYTEKRVLEIMINRIGFIGVSKTLRKIAMERIVLSKSEDERVSWECVINSLQYIPDYLKDIKD